MKLEFETNIFKEGGVYQVDCISKKNKGKKFDNSFISNKFLCYSYVFY